MKPIRILHVVGAMNQGGAETLLMELYRHIDRSLVQFDFLVYNYTENPGFFDGEIQEMGGKIYQAKSRFYREPLSFWNELCNFFEQHSEYRIIHSHQFKMSGFILTAAKRSGNKITIAHSHAIDGSKGLIRDVVNYFAIKLLHRSTDYYLGCSEDALHALSGFYSDGKKRFILKNAIDIEKFSFSAEDRKKWRSALGVDENTLIIGSVGRFLPVKNHKLLVESFFYVNKINPNTLLVLIGSGALEEEINNRVNALGLKEKVVFMGNRSDVNKILNSFDVFGLPSKSEGLGIVLIEAQDNGVPCVISADVIPKEVDVGNNLVKKVSLNAPAHVWANMYLEAPKRADKNIAKRAVRDAGYDINMVSKWLQEFYLNIG